MKFLGHRGATDLCAALEHRHLEAGHGDIGGGYQAVVSAADNNDVRHPDGLSFLETQPLQTGAKG